MPPTKGSSRHGQLMSTKSTTIVLISELLENTVNEQLRRVRLLALDANVGGCEHRQVAQLQRVEIAEIVQRRQVGL